MPEPTEQNLSPGTVYLVGAGPGDPGLITLRGIECLARADVVLCDYLVNRMVLEHAPRSAEIVALGHHSAGRAMSPAEINARMVEEALRGRTVVRLKGGDPSVFGRGGQEMDALRTAGIPFEVVPGVTSALAAAAYAEVPITHRDDASAVALVAGQERRDREASHLDYAALAAFPGTLIFYMSVRSAARWSRALIEHGRSPQTPVAIVRRCTWSEQEVVRCTLATVAEQKLRPPAVAIVGDVAGRMPETSWFAAKPLLGTRVLVTRPAESSDELRGSLLALGADVLTFPAIRIAPPEDWSAVDGALERLDQYDWVVFSSGNGVRYFLDRLLGQGGDMRRLGGVRLAAIGSGTAEQLAHYHVSADLLPEQFRAESLADALAEEAAGRRFLLVRASRGREVLAERLTAAGAEVDQVVAYRSTDAEQADPDVAEALSAGRIDWITVTSSAIARSLVRLFGEALRQSKLVSISPVTSATLRELGFEPAAEADPYTMAGIVEAIAK